MLIYHNTNKISVKSVELVDDKEHLEVREMPSLEENTIVLYVYAASNDIAKLIGRKGIVASSILNNKSIDIRNFLFLIIIFYNQNIMVRI